MTTQGSIATWLVACALATSAVTPANTAPSSVQTSSASDLVERVWYDGTRARTIVMAPDEVAVTFESGAMPVTAAEAERRVRRLEPTAVLQKQVGPVAFFKVNDGHTAEAHAKAARQAAGVRHASPVFYEGDPNPAARLALSGEIILGFASAVSEQALLALAKRHGISLLRALDAVPNTYVFDARTASDSLELANQIYRSGEASLAQPNWIRSATPR